MSETKFVKISKRDDYFAILKDEGFIEGNSVLIKFNTDYEESIGEIFVYSKQIDKFLCCTGIRLNETKQKIFYIGFIIDSSLGVITYGCLIVKYTGTFKSKSINDLLDLPRFSERFVENYQILWMKPK